MVTEAPCNEVRSECETPSLGQVPPARSRLCAIPEVLTAGSENSLRILAVI